MIFITNMNDRDWLSEQVRPELKGPLIKVKLTEDNSLPKTVDIKKNIVVEQSGSIHPSLLNKLKQQIGLQTVICISDPTTEPPHLNKEVKLSAGICVVSLPAEKIKAQIVNVIRSFS